MTMAQPDFFITPLPKTPLMQDVFSDAHYNGKNGVACLREVSRGANIYHWVFKADYAWKTGVRDMFGLSFACPLQVYRNFIENGGSMGHLSEARS